MKRLVGFSLIEITFGLLISSLLSIMLFQVNGTISRLSMSIESSLGYLRTIPLLANQLERDISAVYVPRPIYQLIEREFKNGSQGKKSLASDQLKEEDEKKPSEGDGEGGEDKKRDKDPLEAWKNIEPFYCVLDGETALTLSFITTTPRPSFQRTATRLLKVEYRVLPDEQQQGTFQVRRKETFDFLVQEDQSPSEELFGDLLVDGIESLTVRMIGVAKQEVEEGVESAHQGEKDASMPPQAIKSESATTWNKKDAQEQYDSLLPLAIEFEGVLRSGPGGRTHPFIFAVPIAASFGSMVELFELRLKKPKDKAKENVSSDLQKNKNRQK